MDKNDAPPLLPVLDRALGDRIRYVVDLFDRKKDAAKIAGVIPEQLNRWCHAQSEPRFVGVTRLALSKGIRVDWVATGQGEPENAAAPTTAMPDTETAAPVIARDMLQAIISGFLEAEGIRNAPEIAQDILIAHDSLLTGIDGNPSANDTGMALSKAISSILSRQQQRIAPQRPG